MILINIFLLSVLLSLILTFKKPTTALYCGIFGFNGREGKKADLRKLLILGLYNRTRGTDSCGYYYNGNIVKGIDKEADFKDFVINNKFIPGDLPYETLMAHTRKSTFGSNSLENAHPHNIENYVQTHNGTLKNIWTLCNRYKIDHTKIHVDSIGLAAIIQKDGFKVLNEYEGYAALTMVFMDDPQSLYLYHGASRDKEEVPTLWEERPLYTLETPEGLYYSSMEESLAIINTSKKVKPEVLPHNRVYLIQNGEIVKSVYKVERSEMNIQKVYVCNNYNENWNKNYYDNKKTVQKALPFNTSEKKETEGADTVLFTETLPAEYLNSDVYFRCGRFFTVVSFATDKTYSSIEVLLNGVYDINRMGCIVEEGETTTLSTVERYYFVRGVMMRNKKAYEKCLSENKGIVSDTIGNIAFTLSKYSRFPVTALPGEASGVSPALKKYWFINENRFNGIITPKFTKRRYEIREGQLVKIIPASQGEMVYGHTILEPKNFGIDRRPIEDTTKSNDTLPINELYSYITEIIDDWADKIITQDDISIIPEVVFLYMEHFIKMLEKTEFSNEESIKKLEELLRDLVKTKQTFSEYAKALSYPDWILDNNNIIECFGEFTADDLVMLENRYCTLDIENDDFEDAEIVEPATNDCCDLPNLKEDAETFNSIVENENYKLFSKKLEAKLEEFTELADNFQLLSSDASQDKAYILYKAIKDFTDKIKTK